MTMKSSEAIRWKQLRQKADGSGEWVRRCTGLERVHYMSEQRFHEANILLNVLLRHEKETFEVVSERLRSAWLAVYMQVPQLSTTLSKTDDNVLQATYQQRVTSDDIKCWLDGTFHTHAREQCASEEETWDFLDTFRANIAVEGINRAKDKGHVGLVDVIPCAKDLTGLVFRLDHGVFDGSGALMVVDTLLKNYTKETQMKVPSANDALVEKPLPAPPLLSFVDESTLDADYSGMLQSLFASKPEEDKLNHVVSPVEILKHATKVYNKRFTFSQEETSQLLREAKKHGVTISQIIVAAHLVPMLKRFPIADDAEAQGKTRVQFGSPLNPRPWLVSANEEKNRAAKDCYGSEVVLADYHVAIADMTEHLRRGQRLETKEDAECVLRIARLVDATNKGLAKTFQMAMSVFNKVGESIPEPKVGDPAFQIGHPFIVSDGLIERYVARQYGDDLQVLGVHMIVNLQMAYIGLRSITFRDCLTLSINYGEEIWSRFDMVTFLDEWVQALRDVLLA